MEKFTYYMPGSFGKMKFDIYGKLYFIMFQ